MAPPKWWLRFIGLWDVPPSQEFEQATHLVDDREDRINALELRVRLIERRLNLNANATPADRKSA
jgi:hypothetical protein